jgi:acetate kinase
MTRAVLTLNAGSSSLKVALFPETGDRPLATGLADRIGPEGVLKLKDADGALLAVSGDLTSHAGAIAAVIDCFRAQWTDLDLRAVGHRVVHGGADRTGPTVVDDAVLTELDRLTPFAPLHQPHNLAGIRAAMQAFIGVPQVACFDTAFHRTNPKVSDSFALPRALYDEGVRRYGFHGLSYDFIAGELARRAPPLAEGRVIVAHLGNGASMCGLQNGRSLASTMGFTALDGLPMGTRCGQIDPGVLLYLMDQKAMTAAEITDLLYKQSGLLGLSGLSNDMRTLEASGTPEAAEAIEYFVYRCQRELGSLAAALGGIDALIFCGGIGENSRLIRARICERLGWMGIEIDHGRNAANDAVISSDLARTTVMVIPTNEELVIARAARAAVGMERDVAA